MPLLIVRHARAGKRWEWEGDDRERPLDKKGRREAGGLLEQFAPYSVERIASSPSLRCTQNGGAFEPGAWCSDREPSRARRRRFARGDAGAAARARRRGGSLHSRRRAREPLRGGGPKGIDPSGRLARRRARPSQVPTAVRLGRFGGCLGSE